MKKEKKEIETEEEPKGSEVQDKELSPEEIAEALKQREQEAEKREQPLEKKVEKKEVVVEEKKEDENENEDEEGEEFWADKKEKEVEASKIERLIEEKIKPIQEREMERVASANKKARESFFMRHPEYITDAVRWQNLLDEFNTFNLSSADYGALLEKAHRIIDGSSAHELEVDEKKKSFALDASGGGGSNLIGNDSKAEQSSLREKKIAQAWNVDDKAVTNFKKLEKEGKIRLGFYPSN